MGAVTHDRRAAERWKPFDFQRPAKLTRENVQALEVFHDVFARQLTSRWSEMIRSTVQVEHERSHQITFDDYTRSLPNPNVIGEVRLPPLPGAAIVETDVQFAYLLMDRRLGGKGWRTGTQRPSEVEEPLLRSSLEAAAGSLHAMFESVGEEVGTDLAELQFNPQLLQTTAPSETVVVLVFRVTPSSDRVSGVVTVCYPFETLQPLLRKLVSHRWNEGADTRPASPLAELLPHSEVDVTAELNPAKVSAAALADLRYGDVLRLRHRDDEPARLLAGGTHLGFAELGRAGSRRAVRVTALREGPPAPEPEPSPQPQEEEHD